MCNVLMVHNFYFYHILQSSILFLAEFMWNCMDLARLPGFFIWLLNIYLPLSLSHFSVLAIIAFVSLLLQWRSLWRNECRFSRTSSFCSHGFLDLVTHFSRHMINSFSTYLSRQRSVFNNSKAVTGIVQFSFENDFFS